MFVSKPASNYDICLSSVKQSEAVLVGPGIRGFCTKPPKAPETKAAPKAPKAPETKAAPKTAAAAQPPPPTPAKPAGPTVPTYVSSATPSAPAGRELKIVYGSDQIGFALKPLLVILRAEMHLPGR